MNLIEAHLVLHRTMAATWSRAALHCARCGRQTLARYAAARCRESLREVERAQDALTVLNELTTAGAVQQEPLT